MFDRYIQSVPTFSEEECKLIIDECNSQRKEMWNRSTVYGEDGYTGRVDHSRTNDHIGIDDTFDVYDMVVERLNSAYEMYSRYILAAIPKETLRMPMPMADNSKSMMETPGLLRYEVGQKYDWHHDACFDVNAESHDRVISVVTYLNNDFEGGKTEFVDGKRKAEVGHSLMFPSNWVYAHRATPVKKGTKYAIVTWYRIWS